MPVPVPGWILSRGLSRAGSVPAASAAGSVKVSAGPGSVSGLVAPGGVCCRCSDRLPVVAAAGDPSRLLVVDPAGVHASGVMGDPGSLIGFRVSDDLGRGVHASGARLLGLVLLGLISAAVRPSGAPGLV